MGGYRGLSQGLGFVAVALFKGGELGGMSAASTRRAEPQAVKVLAWDADSPAAALMAGSPATFAAGPPYLRDDDFAVSHGHHPHPARQRADDRHPATAFGVIARRAVTGGGVGSGSKTSTLIRSGSSRSVNTIV